MLAVMTQSMVVEVVDEEGIEDEDVGRIANLIESLAATRGGISRLKLEVEVEVDGGSSPGTSLAGLLANGHGAAEEAEGEAAGAAANGRAESMTQASTENGHRPPLNPQTRRWTLASILHRASDALSVRDIVEASHGESWEMTQSGASAELYNMYEDGLVTRSGSPYAYDLTEIGADLLVERSREEAAKIEPDPFGG